MNKLNAVDWVALILIIIGGINWGLIGFFKFDLVAGLFGDMAVFSRIIYSVMGISALYIAGISAILAKK